MGLSNKLSYEAGNFSCPLNLYRFFQSEVLRLYFPVLEPCITWSVSLPSCFFWFICIQMWNLPVHQLPHCPPVAALLWILSTWLPVSASPTVGLDECFFFNSLVVRLPYSSIFWQFWLVLFLNLLSFFWLCEEAQCIYLCFHLGQKSLYYFLYCQITKSKDLLLLNRDEGFASFELTVCTTLDHLILVVHVLLSCTSTFTDKLLQIYQENM